MKRTILAVWLTIFTLAAFAQGGVQVAQDQYSKLNYIGYDGGHYVIEVTNKQACGVDFQITWLGQDTSTYIAAMATRTLQLPDPYIGNMAIRSQPLYRCGTSGGIDTYLEVTVPNALPVTFVSITAPRISDTEFMVTWHVADPVNVKEYRIQTSKDGLVWQDAAIVWPGQEAIYKVKINLATKK